VRRIGVACIALMHAAAVGAQDVAPVTVGDAGPGPSGRLLREVLARPYRLVTPDTSWFVVRRSEAISSPVLVLGRSAAIAGAVDGDVVVVGGDLFLRPGARISGRAVAIGGGVYASALALAIGGSLSFRDNTFLISRNAIGYRLDYASLRVDATPPLSLPGLFGVRVPSYDRVNGLTIPFGPALTLGTGHLDLDAQVAYRSDLGKFDPSVRGALQLSRRARARLVAGRGTFTNDSWIWSDAVNSLASLGFGFDTRNYYRADRAEGTLHYLVEKGTMQLEPFVGAVTEQAWSVGPTFGEQRGPWSVLNRTDSLGMWRPNPEVVADRITSALGGAGVQWEAQGLRLRERTSAEVALSAPGDAFTQLTSDLDLSYLTFGEQEYRLEVHWVTTPAGAPPPQRYAYLGGTATLSFNKLLEFGGDELLFVDQRYSYPLLQVTLGLLGSPTFVLRHRLGSAGVGRLPRFEQVIGVGAELTFVRAEIQMDPATGRVRFDGGLSFAR